MTCRKRIRRCQNRGVPLLRDQHGSCPTYCPCGVRYGVRDRGGFVISDWVAPPGNTRERGRRSLETVHFGPEYCVASLPLRRTANGDMEMNAQATKLQAAENI